MPILNGSFEIGTSIVGEAQDWWIFSSSSCSIAGFDEEEKPFETFEWGDYIGSISGSIAEFNSEQYEKFEWGSGDFIDEWYSGWTILTEDEFNWGFDDTWTAGTSAGFDVFDWEVFNDTWVAGVVCQFDSGTTNYESFSDSSWSS